MRSARSLRRAILAAAVLQAFGTAAVAAPPYTWSTGTFPGDSGAASPLAAGDVLNIVIGGQKFLNSALLSSGTINASDDLYFQNGNALTNVGLYDIHGNYSLLDGGWNGGFSNSGTFRKSGGSGTSFVAITGFSSSGTIDTQIGTLLFNTGASFGPGSQFIGVGATVVNNGASFAGSLSSTNLWLSGGSFSGSAAQINGLVNWTAGSLTGTWTVVSGQTLAVNGGAFKGVNGAVTNDGSITATDDLYFQNGQTLSNNGVYTFQGNVGLKDGGWNGSFSNLGTLRKSAGTGTSHVSIAGFSNSGTVEAQQGAIEFNTGATFNDGTQFKGAGQVVVSNGASFNGGFTTAGNLTLAAGGFVGNGAKMNGDVAWTGGTLTGDWELSAGRTLWLNAGSGVYLNGSFSNRGTVAASRDIYLQNGNTLTNHALYLLDGDVGIKDGGWNGSFSNLGTLRKSAGTGTSYVSIAGFSNSGTVEAQQGAIEFNTGALFSNGTQFSGGGQVVVSNGARFVGSFGSSGNLNLAGGTYVGGDGTPGSIGTLGSGSATLNAGTLAGAWVLGPGTQLKLAGSSGKAVNGSITNLGTIAAGDHLFLQNGNTLANQGVYDLKGDVALADGGWGGNFVNTGLLVKSGGTGTSSVASINFVNAAGGTLDVRTGTIQLPGNFSNDGTLKGSGAYATNLLTNNGHVAPGESPGTLTLNGNFAQTAAGFFDVGLDGASFGQLLISGSASLGGTIDAICFGACNYAFGTSWEVMQAGGGRAGSFVGPVLMSGFASGAFVVDYSHPNEVWLTVSEATVGAVPELETYAMLLSGLAVIAYLSRRRRV